MSTPASSSPSDATDAPATSSAPGTTATTAAGQSPAAGHGWRAVAIVLVGAFMALLDRTYDVSTRL